MLSVNLNIMNMKKKNKKRKTHLKFISENKAKQKKIF